jgi:hypothetical protein
MSQNPRKNVVEVASHDLFSGPMRSALVFAARYTHTRNTGGTLAVVRALEQCWHLLDNHTREQIPRESNEAEYNRDDWQRLRDFSSENASVEQPPGERHSDTPSPL